MTSRPRPALLGALVAACALAPASAAQTLTTETVVAGADLEQITWLGSPPGDSRIFVCEQDTGLVRIVDAGGNVLATPFLDLSGVVLANSNERGLLGMAFHPKFAQNGYVYVNYTAQSPLGRTVVERYQVSAGDPNVADPASALEIFSTAQPFSNHNAGDLAFSPIDGYLYIPIGDGGSANDPNCRAQNPGVHKGKILRIDVDQQDAGLQYAIPPDNPFVGDPLVRDEIWAFGVRNPWRFSFDPVTGDLYFGDVGQNSREEINFELAGDGGKNYGWPVMEGDLCNSLGVNNCNNQGVAAPPCFDSAYTGPVTSFVTYQQGNCSIVGGEVYRGCAIPELVGTYLFADYCSGRFYSLEMAGGVATNLQERTAELSGVGGSPVDFGRDGAGELIVANHDGKISRIVAASAPAIVDCDGNGQDDDCEIATLPWADMDGSGTVDACEDFSVDTDTVCVGLGGTQNMSLHAGAANGGKPYLVLGSLAGTSPGLNLGLAVLPLNLDAYLVITIQGANNGAPFAGTFGVLDGQGNASAAFDASPGLLPGSVVGLTANHAFVLFNGSNNVEFASNYTGLTFQP